MRTCICLWTSRMATKDQERERVKDPAQFSTYRFHHIASYYQQLSTSIYFRFLVLLTRRFNSLAGKLARWRTLVD